MQDNGLTDYEQLEQKATAATERFHKLSDQIKSTEAALHTNMELKAATVQYAKTRPVFEKYKASKYSKKFLAEHEADIELYRAACADFKAILGGAKLPKMDTLKEEGRKLSEQKKKLYAEYRKTKADMQESRPIKANIDYLLGYSEPGQKEGTGALGTVTHKEQSDANTSGQLGRSAGFGEAPQQADFRRRAARPGL